MSTHEKAPLRQVAVGLVHYPILDKAGDVVATNITNFDIHDIARACRVYGIENYFIIHPNREQLMFVSRVLDHWRTGPGAHLNPKRKTALGPVKTAESIEDALRQWGHEDVEVVATHAREKADMPKATFQELRQNIGNKPHFIVFGTGFGLAPDAFNQCTLLLEPIRGTPPEDYRHLSVRSAVSICLDRLLGAW
ncbi:MAG: RNA methyltransferase [Bdellovibrionales bacterium]|nr:RNA methyltransferase [Bdellovibrionales bacterium]